MPNTAKKKKRKGQKKVPECPLYKANTIKKEN